MDHTPSRRSISAKQTLTELDYYIADLGQPRIKRPTKRSVAQEQKHLTKAVKKLDPITRKFKRIHTDGKLRRDHYSDSGDVLD